jgi:Sulfotransferase domain
VTCRLPDLVIIGAPKAGTTSLAHWLSEHPQVAMSSTKELEFLDENYHRGLEWYRRQLPDVHGDAVVGEATPTYLADHRAPIRAAEALPQTRFVAILREPVARAWSSYWFFRALGVERRSWRRALAAEASGRAHERADYMARGRYADQIARWDAAVGRDRLLLLLFDDLRADPVGVFAEICRFAGVRDDVVPASTASVNQTPRPRAPMLQWALRATRTSFHEPGRRLWEWNLRSGRRPVLDRAEARALQAEFLDDNRRLERRLGRPLPASWYP